MNSLRIFLSLSVSVGLYAAPSDSEPKRIDFNRDIRPIFSDQCSACHGPDEKKRLANLRLDTPDGGAFSTRGSYRIIVPGDSSKSRLFQRISADKKAMRMPPPVAGKGLSDKQIELVRMWIDQGAKWEIHWAYAPPKTLPPPAVSNAAWPRNAIDNFVLARLDREGLKPSSEAGKATLLRRATLDLTGLPPATAELDAFLADKSPNAYEKKIDDLLNSPRYGERMAMQWLDLARYSDTHGYHIDSHREMWHWRDWVINAFNRNMPFDQFTIEQLAGDLLPDATVPQQIATGFNRNHMINFEGGAIPEEYQTEYVVDRVETTAVTWMGMTMGCARCHDHKYDPIKQKDFYRFFAFFNGIPEKGLDGRKGNAEPYLQIPSAEQEQSLKEVTRKLAETWDALPDLQLALLQMDWEKTRFETLPLPPIKGLAAHYELDGSLSDSSGHYHHGRTLAGEPAYTAGVESKAADYDGETHVDLGNIANFEKNDPFSIALWVRSNGIKEMAVIQKIDRAPARKGFELSFGESIPIGDLRRGAKLSFRLIHSWPDEAIEIQTKREIPLSSKQESVPRPWYQVTVTYDGSGRASGLKLFLNGKPEEVDMVRDRLSGSIQNSAPLEIGNKKLGKPYKGQMDDLRIYNRQLTPEEIEQLAIYQPTRATLFLASSKRSKDQKNRLRDYFLTYDAPEQYRKLYADLKRLEAENYRLNEVIPTTMVMSEMEKPRATAVLGRGDYRNRGEKVSPGVPSFLPQLPADATANRLTLARWLVDPANPLTARVTVNRFWQMYFSNGLVKTAEDFGAQGEAPTHPELLDWLATEFVRTGWDLKAMQRLILTSATYRQSSRFPAGLGERDPENRLLARGPRFRLPAEMVRDNALYVSGLLKEKQGGPSVFPYQPKGLWEDIAYGDVYSAQSYSPSHGDDLYRRSMYTFWKRTTPPPSLATFDAPDREKCTARRIPTNTPLQALVLLNDPTYVEAARALAQRMMTEGGGDAAKRIRYGFRLATGRMPAPKELEILRDIERKQLTQYRANPSRSNDAEKLISVGESSFDRKLDVKELAAWTTVASVILNLDETITKE